MSEESDYDVEWARVTQDEQPPTELGVAQPGVAEAVADISEPGETPTEPVETPSDPESSEAVAAKTEDIWADADPKLKQEWNTLWHRASSDAGRISALTKKLQEMESQIEAKKTAPPPTSDGDTPDEWAKVRGEYPDIVGPFERRLQSLESQLRDAVGEKIQTAQRQQQEYSERIANNTALLRQYHPDLSEIVVSPDFAVWKSNLPGAFAQLLDTSEDPREVGTLLQMFKDQRRANGSSEVEEKRRLQKASATVLPTRQNTTQSSGPPDDYNRAFDYYVGRP